MSSSRFGTFVQNVLCCDLQSYFLRTVRAEHVSESVGGREKERGGGKRIRTMQAVELFC